MPDDPNIIHLNNVRLSFPALFEPRAIEEGKEPTYQATFILDNQTHGALIDKLEAAIDRVALDEFKRKEPRMKSCLHDGSESALDGFGDGTMFIRASRKNRPAVVDRELNTLAKDDPGVPYAGCFVNASLRLFAWSHKTGGKGVSAELRGVQFLKDGESFGAGPIIPEKEFSKIDEEVGDKGRSKQRSVKPPAAAPLDDAGMF